MNQYVKRFDSELNFLCRSERSIYTYVKVAERYIEYTKDEPRFTREEIVKFMSSFGKISATYAAWVLRVLHRFYSVNKKEWPLVAGETPKADTKPQPFVTPDEVSKLLKAVKGKSKRDYALIQILIDTGCRRDELSKLDIDSYKGDTILIKLSKGESFRTVKLNSETKKSLDIYLKGRSSEHGALFLNNSGRGRISPNGITNIVKDYFKRIGTSEPGKGAHSFRRGFVSDLVNKGFSEIEIQKFGAWKSLEMVARYARLSSSKLEKEVAEAKPLR